MYHSRWQIEYGLADVPGMSNSAWCARALSSARRTNGSKLSTAATDTRSPYEYMNSGAPPVAGLRWSNSTNTSVARCGDRSCISAGVTPPLVISSCIVGAGSAGNGIWAVVGRISPIMTTANTSEPLPTGTAPGVAHDPVMHALFFCSDVLASGARDCGGSRVQPRKHRSGIDLPHDSLDLDGDAVFDLRNYRPEPLGPERMSHAPLPFGVRSALDVEGWSRVIRDIWADGHPRSIAAAIAV